MSNKEKRGKLVEDKRVSSHSSNPTSLKIRRDVEHEKLIIKF